MLLIPELGMKHIIYDKTILTAKSADQGVCKFAFLILRYSVAVLWIDLTSKGFVEYPEG